MELVFRRWKALPSAVLSRCIDADNDRPDNETLCRVSHSEIHSVEEGSAVRNTNLAAAGMTTSRCDAWESCLLCWTRERERDLLIALACGGLLAMLVCRSLPFACVRCVKSPDSLPWTRKVRERVSRVTCGSLVLRGVCFDDEWGNRSREFFQLECVFYTAF